MERINPKMIVKVPVESMRLELWRINRSADILCELIDVLQEEYKRKGFGFWGNRNILTAHCFNRGSDFYLLVDRDLAETSPEPYIGFCVVERSRRFSDDEGTVALELPFIWVDDSYRGKKVGKEFFKSVIKRYRKLTHVIATDI